MSLPLLNETALKVESTYAHTFHAIPLSTYNADASCRCGGDGACYSSSNLVSVSGFSINSTDLNLVSFTVPAGLSDRTKIGSWMLAHKIVKIADGSLVGF